MRLGFLVSPDDLPSVRRILRLSSCVWGGRYNPIIPFFKNDPPRWARPFALAPRGLDIARGYVDFFEPDVLVEAAEGMALALGWADDETSRLDLPRTLRLEDLFHPDDRGLVELQAGIDTFGVMAHLYQSEFKYQQRHKLPFALLDPPDAFFEAFIGAYPGDENLKRFSGLSRHLRSGGGGRLTGNVP